MNDVALIIAAVAVIVSIVSFEVNRRGADRAERYTRMPVLLPKSPIQLGSLTIQNIGNGPAMNIVVADASEDLLEEDALSVDLSDDRYREMWSGFHHLEPIAAGAERSYELNYRGALGLSYTDAFGMHYTTFTGSNGTRVIPSCAIPRPKLSKLKYP
jgi:hypothetical protein